VESLCSQLASRRADLKLAKDRLAYIDDRLSFFTQTREFITILVAQLEAEIKAVEARRDPPESAKAAHVGTSAPDGQRKRVEQT